MTAEERQRRERAAAKAEAKRQRAIQDHLVKARQLIDGKKWQAAKDELAYFEGLGNCGKDNSPAVICRKGRSEWMEAKALDQSADVVRRKLSRSTVGWTALIYGGAGLISGGFLALVATLGELRISDLADLFIALFVLVVGAACGSVSSALYAVLAAWMYAGLWGGKSGSTSDHVLGLLAPVALAVTLASGIGIILVAIVVFVLIAAAGGG